MNVVAIRRQFLRTGLTTAGLIMLAGCGTGQALSNDTLLGLTTGISQLLGGDPSLSDVLNGLNLNLGPNGNSSVSLGIAAFVNDGLLASATQSGQNRASGAGAQAPAGVASTQPSGTAPPDGASAPGGPDSSGGTGVTDPNADPYTGSQDGEAPPPNGTPPPGP